MKTVQENTNQYFIDGTCYICNEVLTTLHDATTHIKKHFDDDGNEKRWRRCDYTGCTKTYKAASSFMEHLGIHYDCLKMYRCQVCEYRTSVKGNMKKHVKRKHKATSTTQTSATNRNPIASIPKFDIHSNESQFAKAGVRKQYFHLLKFPCFTVLSDSANNTSNINTSSTSDPIGNNTRSEIVNNQCNSNYN